MTTRTTNSETELVKLEAEIRASVAREDFTRSQILLDQYRDVIEQHVKQTVLPEVECPPLLARTRELLEWVRRMTLVSRSKYQTRLNALRDAGPYIFGNSGQTAEPRIRFKA